MSDFWPAVALVLKHEGGLEENISDPGGTTCWGISLRFYKQAIKPDATEDDIKNLSVEAAENIYKTQLWDKNRYAELNNQKLANRMLDLCANMGAKHANICLQQAINCCAGQTVDTDGIIGIRTITAANSQPEEKLYYFLIEMAEAHYKDISRLLDNHIFLTGWLNRLKDTP